jgi:hypothetical protein
MSKQIDRSQAERRALSLSMVDGIWDMLMGLFFFVQALIDPIEESLGTTRLVAYIPLIVLLPLGFLAFRWLKQRFTIPRIGLVKTSFRTNQQERRILIIVMVMVAFTGVVFIGAVMGLFEQFGWTGGWLFAWGIDLLFGLLTFAIFSVMAYSLMAPRYYLYGALLGAAMTLTGMINDQGEWIDSLPMMLAGLVMIFVGALVFGRFIRQYPLPAEEDVNG